MTHIANQRIKKGGKHYVAGDPIELTEDELEELPANAASPAPEDEPPHEPAALLPAEQADQLNAAAAKLSADDFKQDGEIRAGALRELVAGLGFEVTAEQVAVARPSVKG